jgi:hypothetical protein
MNVQQSRKTDQPDGERVRKNTALEKNSRIDAQIIANIREYSKRTADEISARLRRLDKEWDIERVLETNMSVIALAGLALGVFVNAYWLMLPGIVLLFFLQHALQGWCPPIPLFRAFKVRTRPEIDREKYALKALRGDFNDVSNAPEPSKAEVVFEATKRI